MHPRLSHTRAGWLQPSNSEITLPHLQLALEEAPPVPKRFSESEGAGAQVSEVGSSQHSGKGLCLQQQVKSGG